MNIELILLVLVGFLTGCINTLAGGGSMLSLSFLIFLGLPSTVANATNRIGVLIQCIAAQAGFNSKKIAIPYKYGFLLTFSTVIGTIIGTSLAINLSEEVFNRILALLMTILIFYLILKKDKSALKLQELLSVERRLLGATAFFGVGIYIGLIQAGVGILIAIILSGINKFSLVKSNAIKTFIVLCSTVVAIILFQIEGLIDWKYGLILGSGNFLGGWIASRWSVKKGDKTIKLILIIMLVFIVIKLCFFK